MRLNEYGFKSLIVERVKNILNGIISDEDGHPIVFYHSYDVDESYNSGLIYLSSDREFSSEFGDNTDAFYISSNRPYITEDEYLRDSDGNLIMFDGEPASIGWLDAIPEEYLEWFKDNYDCMMDDDGVFAVVFDRDNLIPVNKK